MLITRIHVTQSYIWFQLLIEYILVLSLWCLTFLIKEVLWRHPSALKLVVNAKHLKEEARVKNTKENIELLGELMDGYNFYQILTIIWHRWINLLKLQFTHLWHRSYYFRIHHLNKLSDGILYGISYTIPNNINLFIF